MKYVSSEWKKVSSYAVSNNYGEEPYVVQSQYDRDIISEKASGFLMNFGVIFPHTQPEQVTTELLADASRYSRVCVVADYYVQNMKSQLWFNGTLILDKPNCTVSYPTGDTYLAVVYQ